MLLLWLSLIGCESAPPPTPSVPDPPVPSVELEAPWRLVEQDSHSLVLQLADTPHGVRVDLGATTSGTAPGITPVWKGRTLRTTSDHTEWPMIALPFPEHAIQDVRVLVQGMDLVVRIEGPPLTEVTTHPDADTRPIVTQVRLRPRPGDWRIVIEGVTVLCLPGPGTHVTAASAGWEVESAWGGLALDTEAPAWTSQLDRTWRFDTRPSIEETEPYPRTTVTWSGP